jgi:hypothetical protein
MAQVLKSLPSKCEAQNSNPSTTTNKEKCNFFMKIHGTFVEQINKFSWRSHTGHIVCVNFTNTSFIPQGCYVT